MWGRLVDADRGETSDNKYNFFSSVSGQRLML